MATEAEIIASNILASAIEYKRLYDTTKKNEYKVKEQRLRQIAENIKLIVSSSSSSSVSSFNGRTGAVTLTSADVTGALGYTPPTTLDGLNDVTISAPANAQILTYNSSTSQWENQTPGTGTGVGDMDKSTYDVDNDGIVDGAETIQIIVRNSTGSTLTKGQVVYLNGATGNRPNAYLSKADAEATSSKTLGIVVANIPNNSDGYIAVNGTLHNLDTSAFADGVAVWLSATTAGGMTSTIPAEPNHTVFIGYIARSHPIQGRLVILIQNGYELNELHGVQIASEANNDLLVYESSTSLWKNKTFTAIFGGTPLVSVPTLAQVTTAGNTTSNTIIYSGTTEAIRPSVDSTGALGASNFRWGTVYTRAVNSGANSLDILGTNINLNDNSGNIKLRVFGSTGNVVIQNGGTFTDAGYRLDVQGNTRVNGGNTSADTPFIINNRFQFKGDGVLLYGNAAGHGRLTWDSSGAYFGGLSGYGLGLGANGSLNHVFINTSGNVGVGTTSPAYKLDVNGTVRVSNNFTVEGTISYVKELNATRYFQIPTGIPTNNLGQPTIAEMALFDKQFDNKTAFYPTTYGTSIFTFETYNGTTWTDISSTITDTEKKKLFGGDNTSSVNIPYGTVQYQITITNPGPYVYLNAFYAYWSGSGHSTQVQLWAKHNSGSWTQITNSTTTVSSWPGHLYLPHNTIPWHPTGTLGVHYHQVRVVFTPTWNATYPTNNIALYNIEWWGGYPAGRRLLYSADENKNVTFPSGVTAAGTLFSAGAFTANSSSTFAQLATFNNSAVFNNAAGTSAIRIQHNGTNRGILGTDAAIYGVSTANVGLYVYGANDLELSTDNVKRLIIKANGNILIGTTTDNGNKLNVAGTTRLGGNTVVNGTTEDASGTATLTIQTTNTSLRLGGNTTYSWIQTHSSKPLYINELGNNVILNLAGGSVGIGTASPSYKLDVNGTARVQSNFIVDTDTLFVDATNNRVGIGTATPTDKLHIIDSSNANIFGRITATGTNASAAWVAMNNQNDNVVYRVFGDGVSGSQMGITLARSASLLANLGGSGKFLLGTFSATDFVMGTGNAEKVRIVDSTGNFLIGTTSDNGNKLQVNGTIDGQAFAVNGVNGWTGTIMIAGNPPGMQNIDVQGGIIMNVF